MSDRSTRGRRTESVKACIPARVVPTWTKEGDADRPNTFAHSQAWCELHQEAAKWNSSDGRPGP